MAYDTNPLVGLTWSDTVRSCAAVLDLLTALDLDRLTDRARTDGIDIALMPVIAALDATIEEWESTITLNPEASEHLRAFGRAHGHDSIAEMVKVLIQAGEEAAQRRATEAADPERLRPSWIELRALADDELRKLGEALDTSPVSLDEPDLTTYTVILLYPEPMNSTGSETYTWVGAATDPDHALAQARYEAYRDNGLEPADDLQFPLIGVLENSPRFCMVREDCNHA